MTFLCNEGAHRGWKTSIDLARLSQSDLSPCSEVINFQMNSLLKTQNLNLLKSLQNTLVLRLYFNILNYTAELCPNQVY